MPGNLIGASATILAILVASCRFPASHGTSCDDDVALCPHSSTVATSVTCDCRCTLGFGEAAGQSFDGHIAMCLPSELNTATASSDQMISLRSIDAQTFDQRVYQFCSRDVAGFLRTMIRVPRQIVLACTLPVKCDCSTSGTKLDSPTCHTRCGEKPCDSHSCPFILRNTGQMDLDTCSCSRVSSCGTVAPAEDLPPLCKDWTPPVLETPAGPK